MNTQILLNKIHKISERLQLCSDELENISDLKDQNTNTYVTHDVVEVLKAEADRLNEIISFYSIQLDSKDVEYELNKYCALNCINIKNSGINS